MIDENYVEPPEEPDPSERLLQAGLLVALIILIVTVVAVSIWNGR